MAAPEQSPAKTVIKECSSKNTIAAHCADSDPMLQSCSCTSHYTEVEVSADLPFDSPVDCDIDLNGARSRISGQCSQTLQAR